jgi:hypothetical protein
MLRMALNTVLSLCHVQVQLPAVDPAKQYAADFRMQATSYAAYMMVRDYQTVGGLPEIQD